MNKYSSVDFNPFDGQEIQKICITNESQKEIWLSCVFGGGGASLAYNLSISLHFTGSLNLPALEKSISDLILRHESLRSSFSNDGEKLIIYENFPIDLLIMDDSQLESDAQKDSLKQYTQQQTSTPFDLENGPLLRACLHQFGSERNVLTLTTHHIIADGTSLNIMIEDLSNFYTLHTGGKSIKNSPLPYQISAYSEESLEFKKTEEFLNHENYWIELYQSGIPATDLKTDFPRTPNRSFQGERLDQSIEQSLYTSIKNLSRHSGCSLITLFISAFEVYLAKATSQSELVLGIFSGGRPEEQHADMIGHCVNLLPLKASIDDQRTFADYLKVRKGQVLDAIDHQQFTFSQLIKKLYVPRDPSRVPLVPIVFNFEHELGSESHFEGLTFQCISNPREYENFELNLNIVGRADTAILQFYYNKDLFKQSTIKRMMGEFHFFLQELVEKPSAKIQELRIQNPKDLLAKIAERNNTHSSFSKDETLLSYINDAVEKYPHNTAIRYYDEHISFEDLDQQANRLAHILIEKGVKEGDNVGIALNRSPKLIVTILAVLKSGAVYIPLDPEFPHDRIVYMLENSAASVLITSNAFRGHFDSNAKELLIEDCWNALDSYSSAAPICNVRGEDLAYILYTSGSTGKPKGVQIRHYNLLNFLLSMQKKPGIKPTDKWLAITTVSFDIAVLEIFLPLISGAEIVLADEGMTRNGAGLLSIIREQGITIMQATPATWTMMLYEGWEEKLPLKILCGGEAFPKTLATKLLERSFEVWNMYGPTETTVWSTIKQLSLDDQIITVGRPIDNTLIYILDDKLDMVQEGIEGEIYIAGDGLALGYMNRPDLSQEKFIDNPFEPAKSSKIYGTGDLGIALENGEIQCLGRLDHQVKIRGFRIELGEIEYSLSKIESIKDAVVVVREISPDDKRLSAYIIPNIAIDDSIENSLKTMWRSKLKDALPPYMIPNDFILVTAFPLTPNGKIDRKKLSDPGSDGTTNAHLSSHEVPTSPMAQAIAKVWAEYLGAEEVHMKDDFFRLGGNYTLGAQLMIQLERITSYQIPLTSLFKNPVFESFVRLYEDPEALEVASQPIESNEDHLKGEEIIVPTTEAQKEVWLSCMIGGDEANLAYNLPSALKMVGKLNISAFKNALETLVNRHEALRTNISESGESLIIHPHLDLTLETNDLSALEERDQDVALKAFIQKEMNIPFTLSNGPLLRTYLHKINDNTYYFALIIHNIICDSNSIHVIFNELSLLYNAYTSDQKISLGAAPQISNFNLEQLTFNNSGDYHLTQNYWLDQYKHQVPVLDLPIDYPRTSSRKYVGEQNDYTLKNGVLSNFKRIGEVTKCSMTNSILSAFEIFLHYQTRQNEVVVGVPVSGQVGPFYGLIGHAFNTLPLRSKVDTNESFHQYLINRTEKLHQDYNHQRLNYSLLLKQLHLKRDLTRIPLMPVMFSMRLAEDIVLNGLQHSFEQHPLVAQTFEISLYVIQYEESLGLTWVYDPDLFEKETIDRFHANFTSILEQLGQHPDLKIKDLVLDQKHGKNSHGDQKVHSLQPSSYAGPSTDTETLVATIWSEHLDMPIINVKSDFFELGGHSMIAVKIMMAIEKTIGKRLPLATLFENSTIEKLAKKIESDQKEVWKSLVPIKTSGSKPPLYIVHGAGMNVIGFNTLVNSIDSDQPLYGLQAKGLDPNDEPFESIEEIAQDYVREIIEQNPNGPYAIAGYSSGGTIALEMSEQLLKLNKKVSFLALFDTCYDGDSYSSLIKRGRYKQAFNQAFNFIGYGFVYLFRYPRVFIQHKVNFILGTLYNQYKKINPMKKDLSNPLYVLDRIQKTHDKAFEKYTLKKYKSNVTLYKGNQKTLTHIPHLNTNGFAPFIEGDLTIIDIPADHLSFFEPEYADMLGEKVQEELNKCIH